MEYIDGQLLICQPAFWDIIIRLSTLFHTKLAPITLATASSSSSWNCLVTTWIEHGALANWLGSSTHYQHGFSSQYRLTYKLNPPNPTLDRPSHTESRKQATTDVSTIVRNSSNFNLHRPSSRQPCMQDDRKYHAARRSCDAQA